MPVRNLGKVVHYAKVQLRFQHSQVRVCSGINISASLRPGPQTLRLATLPSLRTSVIATWSCSPPTSTSRPMVLKDSHSR